MPRDASAAELKAAYRRCALAGHPDVCKAPDADAQFRAVAEAYRRLHNPVERKAYDAQLAAASRRHVPWASGTANRSGASRAPSATAGSATDEGGFWSAFTNPRGWGTGSQSSASAAPSRTAAASEPFFDARSFFRDVFGSDDVATMASAERAGRSPWRANGNGQSVGDWFTPGSSAALRGVFDPPPTPWDTSKPPPPIQSKGEAFREQMLVAKQRASRARGGGGFFGGGASELDRLTEEDWRELEEIAKR